jgi:hypothetical protein
VLLLQVTFVTGSAGNIGAAKHPLSNELVPDNGAVSSNFDLRTHSTRVIAPRV